MSSQADNMDIVKKIYSRPTMDMAVMEVIKDYLSKMEGEGVRAEPEALCIMAREQVEQESRRRDFDTT